MKKLMMVALCALAANAAFATPQPIGSSSTTWELTENNTVLTIGGTGAMPDFKNVKQRPWFNVKASITTAIIGSGVTSIGQSAFQDCSGLTGVKIPASVTSIGLFAFQDCSVLTGVKIPASVTSIGRDAFWGCSGLGDGVVIIDGCVLTVNGDCPAAVVLPEGVRLIADRVFFGCGSLTKVKIPSSVTSIGEFAFKNCSGLGGGVVIVDGCVLTVNGDCPAAVVLPEGVRLIAGGAFEACSSLVSVEIPSSVTSIGDSAFESCGVTNVTISEGVGSIGASAFYSCSGLTSVTIPSGVTSIGDGAFGHCRFLERVEIPSSVKSIGNSAFISCAALRNVTIPPGVKSIGDSAFESCGVTNVTISEGVTSIGNSAFKGCMDLRSVTIPPSVMSIGDSAFKGIVFLGGVPLGGNGVAIVDGCVLTVIGDCPDSVALPEGVRLIADGVFAGRYALKSVTIPSSVTIIGYNAFHGCSGLGDGVVIVDGCLLTVNGNCPDSIVLPRGVRLIAGGAFSDHGNLAGVKFLDVTPPTGGKDMFRGTHDSLVVSVPEESVEAYRKAQGWGDYADRIHAIWAAGDSVTAWMIGRTLVLEGSGALRDFEDAESVPWADVADRVAGVAVPEGVTLGKNALAGLSDDVLVSLPALPASTASIGSMKGTLGGTPVPPAPEPPEGAVRTWEALTNAVAVAESGAVIAVGADIEETGGELVVAKGKAVTIKLYGKTVSCGRVTVGGALTVGDEADSVGRIVASDGAKVSKGGSVTLLGGPMRGTFTTQSAGLTLIFR